MFKNAQSSTNVTTMSRLPPHKVWHPHGLSHPDVSRPNFASAQQQPHLATYNNFTGIYRNFSSSTAVSELCTHLAPSPGGHCGHAGRSLRGARAATLAGGPGQAGSEGPAGQRAPRCHPAHGWGRDGPQQSQSHRRAPQSHSSASAVTQLATEGHSVTEMLTWPYMRHAFAPPPQLKCGTL